MCFVIAHLVLLLTARRDRNIRKEFVFLQAQISYAGAQQLRMVKWQKRTLEEEIPKVLYLPQK